MKRLLLLIGLAAGAAWCQAIPSVSMCSPNGPLACVKAFYYNGAGLPNNICIALQSSVHTTVQVSDASLTNVVVDGANNATVTTASPHGLYVDARVHVTGSSTAALNNFYAIATVPSSTTYTFTTSGVGANTYTTGIVIGTDHPLLTAAVWAIQLLAYSGTQVITSSWAGNSTNMTLACTSRTSY